MALPNPREKRGTVRELNAVDRAFEGELATLRASSRRLDDTGAAQLVASPSRVTLETVKHVRRATLYIALHLWSLSKDAETTHLERRLDAARARDELKRERTRWRRVEQQLRAAERLARAAPYGTLGTWTPQFVAGQSAASWVPAVDVLRWTADSAKQLASASSERVAEEEREAQQSPKELVAISRARATFLRDAIKPAGLGVPHLTELVIASEADWIEPPIVLPPASRNYKTLKGQIETLLRRRR